MSNSRLAPWVRVALVMFGVGFGANLFAPLLLVYRHFDGLTTSAATGVFGIYALGLVPSLLIFGPISDRRGRLAVLKPALILSVIGSLILFAAGFGQTWALFPGRLAAGIAVGAAMASGSAWIKELSTDNPTAGARRATIALSSGFGGGPLVAGIIADFLPFPELAPYVIHVLLMGFLVPLVWWLQDLDPRRAAHRGPHPSDLKGRSAGQHAGPDTRQHAGPDTRQHAGPATRQHANPTTCQHADADCATHQQISPATRRPFIPATVFTWKFFWAIMAWAPWVFGTASTSFVVITSIVSPNVKHNVAFAGLIAALTLGTGVVIQPAAKHYYQKGWLPLAILGLSMAAIGLILAVVTAYTQSPWLAFPTAITLGASYGTMMVSGLQEAELLAKPGELGALIGIFYAGTYVGFFAPWALSIIAPITPGGYITCFIFGAIVCVASIFPVYRAAAYAIRPEK